MTAPKKTNTLQDAVGASEKDVAKLQAQVEGVTYANTLEYEKEQYKLADSMGHVPLMKFAHYAEGGVNAQDMGALASFYEVLQDCIADEDWPRFERALIKNKATVEDLMPLMEKAIESITARPTESPSGS